jgi:Holliday junction resolvasome RuvABC DNA-binding subunit
MTTNKQIPICPICGKPYTDFPAISRKDNKTKICPDCGVYEAMQAFGYTEEQIQETILEIRKSKEAKRMKGERKQ